MTFVGYTPSKEGLNVIIGIFICGIMLFLLDEKFKVLMRVKFLLREQDINLCIYL